MTAPPRLTTARERGQPIIGSFCSHIAEEWIEAAGAMPMRLCVSPQPGTEPGRERLPRDACAIAAATLNQLLDGWLAQGLIDAVVVPTTCDWKMKLGEALADRLPVIRVNLPHCRDAGLWEAELGRMADALGRITDLPITRGSLRAARERRTARDAALRELLWLRKADPPPISGSRAVRFADSLAYADPDQWLDDCRMLVNELRESPEYVAAGPRLLLTGSPIVLPDLSLVEMVEQLGGVVVADDFCGRGALLYDLPRDPSSSTCCFFADTAPRLSLINRLIGDFAVDGVIHHVVKGCAVYAADASVLRSHLSARGVPVIEIETEAHAPREAIRTRLQAFLELLAHRKEALT